MIDKVNYIVYRQNNGHKDPILSVMFQMFHRISRSTTGLINLKNNLFPNVALYG